MVSSSRADALPDSYIKYLINSIRKEFNLDAVPIRLFVRKGENPYAGKKKRNN
jgi:GTP-binding protein